MFRLPSLFRGCDLFFSVAYPSTPHVYGIHLRLRKSGQRKLHLEEKQLSPPSALSCLSAAADWGRTLQPIFQVFWAFISYSIKCKCGCDQWPSKCGSWTSHISTTRQLIKEANSGALAQTHRFRNSEGSTWRSVFWEALWCTLNFKSHGVR